MRAIAIAMLAVSLFFGGCSGQQRASQQQMTSIQIIDRNGFKETISAAERIAMYEKTDFLSSQPYEKVVRMFSRTASGKAPSKLTTYHKNGELWQYLEVLNGRACGIYREWHSNGALRLDVGVIEGIGDLSEEAQRDWVFDGLSRAWDERGNLLAEIHYEKGKIQGNAHYYYTTGELSQTIPYENDLIDGLLLYYNKGGQIIGRTPYKKGLREGIATYVGDSMQPSYSEEYVEDRLLQATYHDFSGKIVAKVEDGFGKQPIYVDGALHSTREYKSGLPEGAVEYFDSRGNVTTLFHVRNEMKHGAEWIYYPTSDKGEPKPKLYIEWYEDAIHGMCRSWYSDGTLESEREMVNNQREGIGSAWYQDGSLMLIEEYHGGKLDRGTYMKKGEQRNASSVENGEGTATLFDKNGHFRKRILYQNGQVVDAL